MSATPNALGRRNPWHKDGLPPPPPISVGAAYGLLVLYALSYFVPFYLSKTTRPSPTLSRDAPSVIRARIRFVTLSCLACAVFTYQVLTRAGGTSPLEALHFLGLWPVAVPETLRVLSLTALLFAGPLYKYLIVERGWADWVRLRPLVEVWEDLMTWRNIVAGPVSEEVLFRAASIPLVLLARVPPATTVFLTPVVFGLAHVHHYYEFRLSRPDVPAAASLLRSAFQFTYTTLFGAYATFLFLRTGSLAAVCAVHAFCNCMGLPQVWGRVDPPSDWPAAASASSRRSRPSILWSVVYYVLLIAGALLWYRNLWALSESDNALLLSFVFDEGAPPSA
ncbi:hypothetical protein VTH06DRAFT_3731 [Thermothelomyces fergusii]